MVWLGVVAACGKSDKPRDEPAPVPGPTPDQAQAQQIIEQQLDAMQQKSAAKFPCSLFTQPEIEGLMGLSLDPGEYTFNNVDEDNHQYQADECLWSKLNVPDEARLSVSQTKHFKSGKVECDAGGLHHKLTGLGDEAYWEWQSYGIGELRVCTTQVMVKARIYKKGKDEATNQKIARAVAEKALASPP